MSSILQQSFCARGGAQMIPSRTLCCSAPCSACARNRMRNEWRRRIRHPPTLESESKAATATLSPAPQSEASTLEGTRSTPLADQWLTQHDTPAKGRTMHAAVEFAAGQCIMREAPLVRGRCCAAGRCPGCPTKHTTASTHSEDCFWAVVERDPRFEQVIPWYHSVCDALSTQPEANQANHVRVCCLLAICIQAAASASLRMWLLEALRPSVADLTEESNPIVSNTKGFAAKFALKIPPPVDPAAEPFAMPLAVDDWRRELFLLLINLQTNLFEIDSRSIGIYPSAFLFEHSCQPNARIDRRGDARNDELSLTALAPIACGEPVSFCYCDDTPGASGLTHEPLELRRQLVLRTLGFVCVCDACKCEERLLASPACPRVFLELSVGGTRAGRVEIALRADVAPRTCDNFRALCTGERGVGSRGQRLHLKGTPFHRIIPGFMAQGGATVGESIYGPRFADETFDLKHTGAGILSMANSGPDSNNSGFFITFARTEWNDGKHVVFGMVANGMDVVKAVEAVGTPDGPPSKEVIIVDCGQC